MAILDPVDSSKLMGDDDPQPPVAQADKTATNNEQLSRVRERQELIRNVVPPGVLDVENENLVGNVLQDFGEGVTDSITINPRLGRRVVGRYNNETRELQLSPQHDEADAGYVTKEDTTTEHNTLLHELAHGIQNGNLFLDETPTGEVEADIMAQVLAKREGKPQVPLRDSVYGIGDEKMSTDSLKKNLSKRLNIFEALVNDEISDRSALKRTSDGSE